MAANRRSSSPLKFDKNSSVFGHNSTSKDTAFVGEEGALTRMNTTAYYHRTIEQREAKTFQHTTHDSDLYPRQSYRKSYENLHVFLISLLVFVEANSTALERANSHTSDDAEVAVGISGDNYADDEGQDQPTRLRLRLLLFMAVSQSFLMPLLFFLYGRFDQQGASQLGTLHRQQQVRSRLRLLCRRLLPAIICQLLLQWLQVAGRGSSSHGAPVYQPPIACSPIVLFPLLLSAFELTVSTVVEMLGPARAAVFLEQLQSEQGRVVHVYWMVLVQMDIAVGALFPVNILSVSPFRLTDIPQYFLAYIWGQLSHVTGKVHILAVVPPITMPAACLALSVFFSNVALLDLLVMAIPGLSKHAVLTSSICTAFTRLGGGFSQYAIMYRFWKQLSFASIGPAFLETFGQTASQDCWVTIPGIGRRQLKRYAFITLLVYLPVIRVLQIGVDTMYGKVAETTGVFQIPGFREGLIVSGVLYACRGIFATLTTWTVSFLVVEYIPFARRVLL